MKRLRLEIPDSSKVSPDVRDYFGGEIIKIQALMVYLKKRVKTNEIEESRQAFDALERARTRLTSELWDLDSDKTPEQFKIDREYMAFQVAYVDAMIGLVYLINDKYENLYQVPY